jgi:acetyltransferase-like isoleucine patch superfamily enzyme
MSYQGRRELPRDHSVLGKAARCAVTAALVFGGFAAATLTAPPAIAAPDDGLVQVRVVQDTGAHGYVVLATSGAQAGQQTAISEQVNPPLSDVAVTLSDAEGHTMAATTDVDGLVTFDPSTSELTGGAYRVDVTNPKPGTFYPGFAANGQTPSAGEPFTPAPGDSGAVVTAVTPKDLANPNNEKLSSTTEFVDVTGGNNAYVNTSFWYPPYYCQDNAAVCDASQPWDAPLPNTTDLGVADPTERTLISAPYHLDQQDQPLATKADTGVVYGIAYDRAHHRIFSAAYAKRGSQYGPGGPGAIYLTDLAGTDDNGGDPAAYPLSGTTALYTTVQDAAPAEDLDAPYGHELDVNQDYAFFDKVGKESLGDIDITNDGKYLFGVNMYSKTVFVYDISAGGAAGAPAVYPIPNPGCGDNWRPMGTGVGMDTSYVGGVCSADNAPGDSTRADMDELTAHVYQFDPATGAFGDQVVDQSLAYPRGRGYNGTTCTGAQTSDPTIGRWYSWITAYPAGPNPQSPTGCDGVNGASTGNYWISYPTPMLDDIVEETNGDLVVAFRDRFADQVGFHSTEQNANGQYSQTGEPGAGGDVLRGCRLTDGTFVLDPNLTASDQLAAGSVCTDNNDGSTDSGSEPHTYREYYTGEWRTGFHEESFYGGIALSRSEPTIVSSGFDSTGSVWTQGISAVGRDGALPSGLPLGVQTDDNTSDQFGKGSGMADLEVLCDEAPIQIGNRVWSDDDGDGVQDPGEQPIEGVTVHLYDADGNPVLGPDGEPATTTTNAAGQYYFDNSNVAGGLDQNTDYIVRLDNADDYAVDGPLEGRTPTVANAGDDDEHDSDGVIPGGGTYPQITLTTAGAGEDNHTYDFGFNSPVSIGDYLWIDIDGDGIQDQGESPVPGATVNLLDSNGNVVATTTTDDNGFYAFTNLPPNTDYSVQFPTQVTVGDTTYYLTAPAQGGDASADSNPDRSSGEAAVTTPAAGDNSGEPGEADDPTIDAGYLPPVSIGDYLWIDADDNGIQNDGETPVPGATVNLLDSDGNVVATTTTDGNGFYAFTDLRPDTDFTVQFPTIVTVDGQDYVLTPQGQGDDATVDSNPDQQSGLAPVTTPHTGNNSGEPGEADDPTIDAGYHPLPVSIGDFVWIDTDGDGVQDAEEVPVAGVTVTLLDADGGVVATTTTDGDGYYAFTDLVPNSDYTVQFPTTVTVDGNTYVLTAPTQGGDSAADSNPDQATGEAPVTTPATGANSGEPSQADDPTIDAGYTPLVSIGDYVWIDADGDGVQDAGEAPVPGATVTLLDADGNTVASTTTDADGFYAFTDLDGGTDYTVQFPTEVTVDGIDYELTGPTQGGDDAVDSNPDQATGEAPVTTPAAGKNLGTPGDADDPTIDAGYTPKPVSIGDYVWLDADGDGVQDVGEAPVPGATVTLQDADGNTVATTTTDENGSYAFTDLAPNTEYTVVFPAEVTVDGVEYELTQPTRGSDGASDSNPNPSTGEAAVTTPKTGNNSGAPGQADDPTIDAGYTPKPVSIGDYLWIDADGDGVQDQGEQPVPGATVTLLDTDGNVVGTTTTDENGYYSFTDLTPNTDYTVAFPTTVTVDGIDYALTPPGVGDNPGQDSNPDQQSGLAAVTTPKTGGNSGAPGEADDPTVDAGYFPKPVSIGDYVWIDADGDGVQDASEAPVSGATVTLLDSDGITVATTTTDENGYYAFTDLVPNAEYTVQFPTTVTVDGNTYQLTQPSQGSNTGNDSNPDQQSGQAPVTTPKSGNNSGAPGEADDPTIDAGYIPVLVSVGDYVWIDADGDGIQDDGEVPVAGVTVTLLDADGNVVATTTTDEDGFYAFTDLQPDTDYQVHFPTTVTVDGIDYLLTGPGLGNNPGADSNPDQMSGIALVHTPKSGDNSRAPGRADNPTIDAGYTPKPVSIGDYVWIDADGDGIQDDGEVPVAGVTVTLLDADGNVVGTTTTDEGGFYAFTGLTPNTTYGVQFPTTVTVDGKTYRLAKPGQGSNPGLDSTPDQSTGIAWVTTPKAGSNLSAPGRADDPTIDTGYVPEPPLSYTGVGAVGMIAVAILLLFGGGGLLLLGRRRHKRYAL